MPISNRKSRQALGCELSAGQRLSAADRHCCIGRLVCFQPGKFQAPGAAPGRLRPPGARGRACARKSAWRSVTPTAPRVSSTLKVCEHFKHVIVRRQHQALFQGRFGLRLVQVVHLAQAFHVGHFEIILAVLLLALAG